MLKLEVMSEQKIKVYVNFKYATSGYKQKVYSFKNYLEYNKWFEKQISNERYRKIIGLKSVEIEKHGN